MLFTHKLKTQLNVILKIGERVCNSLRTESETAFSPNVVILSYVLKIYPFPFSFHPFLIHFYVNNLVRNRARVAFTFNFNFTLNLEILNEFSQK